MLNVEEPIIFTQRLRLALSTTFVAILLAACVGVPSALALPPIRECGNFVYTGFAHGRAIGYWTYTTIPGYTPVYNLTTRIVRCAYARPFSLDMAGYWFGTRHYQGFTCINHPFYGEDWDIR